MKLFPDPVRPFAFRVLGRLDLLASLAAHDADEAAHGVRLPVRVFHDFGQFAPLVPFITAITSAFSFVPSV